MNDYCAAIDFGTNTARLLIAERVSGRLVPVLLKREVVRLGGGFTDERGLSDEAWQRGLTCLREFSGIISDYGVREVRASATSAVRDAVNGSMFVDSVLKETGIRLVVIDGDVEARLTLNGVMSALDTESKTIVVVDVGGGSTEFTLSTNGTPDFIKSMPIGVVRLTEGFSSADTMVARVQTVIDQLVHELAESNVAIPAGAELVGTAGTATTLAAIMMEMTDYDYRRVNNYMVSRRDISDIFQRLILLTPQERLAVKGLEKGREDLIIAGMVIIMAIMDRFGFHGLRVSDFGLLEGIALSENESCWEAIC